MNLNELDQWLAERNLGGHWSRHGDQGVVRPFLWKWGDIYQGLMWANELVPMEKTGRRTITLKNPGLKVGMTPTIHMSVQCVLPGEIATAHRHNFSAIRFILKGSEKAHAYVLGPTETTSLRALNRYQIEQGLMKHELDILSLFVPGTI